MLESVEKDQLYTALAQAQIEFPTIRVNRKAFKNEYADLYAMLKPAFPVMTKYGLSIHEYSGYVGEIHVYGVRLAHKSGQYITNAFPFVYDDPKPSDQKTHKIAGSQTYFFRYYVKGILGLLVSDDPEDNDGQHGSTSSYINQDELNAIEHFLDKYADREKAKEMVTKIKSHYSIEDLANIPKDKYVQTIERIVERKYQLDTLNK
jgi:ERF superfamily protein